MNKQDIIDAIEPITVWVKHGDVSPREAAEKIYTLLFGVVDVLKMLKEENALCDQCGEVYNAYFVFGCKTCTYDICFRCRVEGTHECLGVDRG